MAGRIRREDIEALRERVDVVDVIGDHTKLQRAGARMKGLCPFHQERTPSFTVDPGQGVYYCFGCQAGGDVFTFLEQVEGLSFVEAVEQLARRVGFTLHYEQLSAGEKEALGRRSQLVRVTQAALDFFRTRLFEPDGEVARTYLKQRGFGRADADRFKLGYAPNAWEDLSRALVAAGVDQRDLVASGLAVRNDRGGLRDRFRGRLIFPVFDLSNDPIGFGGRVLPELDYGDHTPPKYLNSPETPLYHKSKVLYGLNWARPQIVRDSEVLICEGYTDVMALHQAGYTNAVATCGTAVGAEHLRLLQRYADRVVLAFDADEAGAKAAERAWELSRAHELEVRVLVLPAGRDPADLVRDEGGEALEERVGAATPVVPFLLSRRIAEHDLGSPEGKAAAVRAVAPIIAEVPDAALRRQYAEGLVADQVGLSVAVVAAEVEAAGGDVPGIGRGAGPSRPAPVTVASRRQAPARPRDEGAGGVREQEVALERDLLSVALQHPQLLPDSWFDLEEDDLSHPVARSVYRTLQAAGGPGTALTAVLEVAPDDDVRTKLRELALRDLVVEPDEAHVRDLVHHLLVRRLDGTIAQRRDSLARMNYNADPEGYRLATRELEALEHRRRELLERD